MVTKPSQIGITGGIGSGKSLICQIFNRLGIPSYDADLRARWLMDHDPELRASIQREFSNEAYLEDGSLNRDLISKLVFDESTNIEILNSIVHPAVGHDYRLWVEQNNKSVYLLKEAALIFESGSNEWLDEVITVFAPKEMRIERVLIRDPNRDRNQVESIISKQWTEEERQKHADYIIRNDDTTLVIPQVLQIHHELMDRAKDRRS